MNRGQQFQLRLATVDDIAELRELIHASVLGLAQDDYSPAQIEGSLDRVLGLDTQLIEDQTYFVAAPVEDRQAIAGCGGWSYRHTLCGSDDAPNRQSTLLDPSTEAAKIRAIFVHPRWARRGLGTLILKHCEEAAERAGFRHFEMGSTLTGVPLYTLKGYEQREHFEIALANGERLPVIRMVKSLASISQRL